MRAAVGLDAACSVASSLETSVIRGGDGAPKLPLRPPVAPGARARCGESIGAADGEVALEGTLAATDAPAAGSLLTGSPRGTPAESHARRHAVLHTPPLAALGADFGAVLREKIREKSRGRSSRLPRGDASVTVGVR